MVQSPLVGTLCAFWCLVIGCISVIVASVQCVSVFRSYLLPNDTDSNAFSDQKLTLDPSLVAPVFLFAGFVELLCGAIYVHYWRSLPIKDGFPARCFGAVNAIIVTLCVFVVLHSIARFLYLTDLLLATAELAYAVLEVGAHYLLLKCGLEPETETRLSTPSYGGFQSTAGGTHLVTKGAGLPGYWHWKRNADSSAMRAEFASSPRL